MGALDFIKIALSILIASMLVMITFKVVKPSTESIGKNLTSMTDKMSQMNDVEFQMYDQKEAKGGEVEAAIKLYQESNKAILVHNLGAGNETDYTNYCALMVGATPENPKISVDAAKFYDNTFSDDGSLEIGSDATTGGITRNKKFSNINRTTSKIEYIRPTANYDTRLIKNANGEIIGIAFKQQKN